jgi:hypothetical protein
MGSSLGLRAVLFGGDATGRACTEGELLNGDMAKMRADGDTDAAREGDVCAYSAGNGNFDVVKVMEDMDGGGTSADRGGDVRSLSGGDGDVDVVHNESGSICVADTGTRLARGCTAAAARDVW